MAEPDSTKSTSSITMPDDSVQWWELTDSWHLIRIDPPLASLAVANHTHDTHGDINFIGIVSADGDIGLTGQKTIAGYTFTFKKGLLTGFQAP